MRRITRSSLGVAAALVAIAFSTGAAPSQADSGQPQLLDANPTEYYYIDPPLVPSARVDWWDFDPDTLDDLDEFFVYDIAKDGYGTYASFAHPNGTTYSATNTNGANGNGVALNIANLKDNTTGKLKICMTQNGKPISSLCQSWNITE
ncbi:hypothetical protein [Streptomyces sp. NBC_01022]|nr:hypothetical protein [Streptomyces sp. NBC_01022]WRZ81810.1 hypothetical protein OG316_16860 [Streptomyces sp. NBC_01022]